MTQAAKSGTTLIAIKSMSPSDSVNIPSGTISAKMLTDKNFTAGAECDSCAS